MITAAAIIIIIGLGFVYWSVLRPQFFTWGSSEIEHHLAMAGDAAVERPNYKATLAVTIAARPEHIWPWLVQMGYRRGGLYSYDWLDRLFGYLDGPSANRILPLFQHLEVGDQIPIGRGGGFPVRGIEPYRSLVLAGENNGTEWAWQFALRPLNATTTRLVSRNQVHTPTTFVQWCVLRVIEPAAFLMTRRMLLGLKARAEAVAAGTISRTAA